VTAWNVAGSPAAAPARPNTNADRAIRCDRPAGGGRRGRPLRLPRTGHQPVDAVTFGGQVADHFVQLAHDCSSPVRRDRERCCRADPPARPSIRRVPLAGRLIRVAGPVVDRPARRATATPSVSRRRPPVSSPLVPSFGAASGRRRRAIPSFLVVRPNTRASPIDTT
jgi:hypothetical protein